MQTPVALLGLPSVQDVVEKVTSTIWGAFADALIPDAFKNATGKIFTWLVAIPNPARASSMPNIDQLHSNVMALSVAVFALVVVTASVRYFFAGVAGRANPVEALGRALGGGFGLLIYTWAFGNVIAIVNVLIAQIFAWPVVTRGVNSLAAAVLGTAVLSGTGPIAAIFSIIAFVLILALIAMKIALLIVLTMLYVGGPLAIAVWPLPELSGFTRSWLEVLKNVISVPLMWTLVFATAGVLAKDIPTLLGLGSSGIARGAITAIVTPIVAIIVFYIAFRIAVGSIGSIRAAGSQMVAQGNPRTRLGAVAAGMAMTQGRGAVMRAVRGGTGGAAAATGTTAAPSARNKLAVSGASAPTGGNGAANPATRNSQAQRTATSSDQAASRGRSTQPDRSADTDVPAARAAATRPNPSGATRGAHDAPNASKNAAQRLDSPAPRANPPKTAETTPSVRRKASTPPPTAPSAGPSKAASAARPATTPNPAGQPSTPPPSQRSKVERAGGNSSGQPKVNKPRRANRAPRDRRPKPGGAS